MSTTFFYHAQAAINQSVEFDSSEATHISKALRLKSGDHVELTNGRGDLFRAELSLGKHRVSARVEEELTTLDSYVPLHLGIAPTKNADRIEWMVEKAVELGVGEISLLNCDHSERSRISVERINRVAIAALKQSQRTFMPRINETVDFLAWLKRIEAGQRFIAHCMEHLPRVLLRDSIQLNPNGETLQLTSTGTSTSVIHKPLAGFSSLALPAVYIAIGPEGDFSEAEVIAAQGYSFKGVSLGNARLRTETAAIAAVHTYNLINQH
jgi:16S rRNA (uracil1498-N3)-methyltransferase